MFRTNITPYNIISISFSLIPFSFILGNSILNLNLLFIVLYSFFLFKFQIFNLNFKILDKLIIFFFAYVILNGFYNNFFNFNIPEVPDKNIIIKKSFLYLRFLLLYFVIRALVEKN